MENLQYFYEKIKDYPNITAAVVQKKRLQTIGMEEQLLQKVIQKGIEQADRLAKAIDKKRGSILAVADENTPDKYGDNQNGKWTAYPPHRMMNPFQITPGSLVTVQLEKTLRITFALEE